MYIDESGDRGMAPQSSRYFVVSAVIVADEAVGTTRHELATLRTSVGRSSGGVLHFRKLTHSQRLEAANRVAQMPILTCCNVILCKHELRMGPAQQAAHITQPDPMYLYALRLLLERISWYSDEHGQSKALVTFSHVRRFKASGPSSI